MQRIAISKAKPGFTLAEPAETDKGQIICAPGTELSESLITRLVNFGVSRVTVEGKPVATAGSHRTAEEQVAALDTCFMHHTQQALMMEVKQVFRERLEARLADAHPLEQPSRGV